MNMVPLCAGERKLSAKNIHANAVTSCKWPAPTETLSRPGLSTVTPTTKTCRRGPRLSPQRRRPVVGDPEFGKRTCKPNSVVCGHSSRRRVAADAHQRPTRRFRHCMEQPERALRQQSSRLNASGRCAAPHGSMRALPSLFGLAPCGVYPAPGVTAGAVRSCRTFSPLPRR